MTDPVTGQWITVPTADGVIAAYRAVPAGAGPWPVVVVLQEIFGVNVHIREVTERIAAEGYVAIAPALYHRLAPGFEAGYTAEDIQVGRQYKDQTQAAQLLGDIQAVIAIAQDHPQAKAGGVGCIGFCFGGHGAYLAATLPEVAATASFYGAGIVNWCPGGGAPTVDRTGQIGGEIWCFFGTEDASIPPDHIATIESALERHAIAHRILTYDGADHGFFCDRRGSYHPAAAAAAWEQVKTLFARLAVDP
ncbi:MAG: dienelactone hydrolase family protein [Cyanobacteria bacterium]|nr:dienelactone hydrolase family protein [Cyanobacteriota bacterium]